MRTQHKHIINIEKPHHQNIIHIWKTITQQYTHGEHNRKTRKTLTQPLNRNRIEKTRKTH